VGLHVHRAERTDVLAEALADLLATPPQDPFAQELVVVPAKGVERWLSQRLSHRLGHGTRGGDGVCAGVRFVNPRSLVGLLLEVDADDPWHPDRLVWPLLAVIDDSLDESWCAPVARHLGHGLDAEQEEVRRGRRFTVAQRLARLFASYAAQRPGLLDDWTAGRDTDGHGADLDPDLAWQPHLWRGVRARIDAPTPGERHAATVRRLTEEPDTFDLPERLSLFGHTRISVTEIDLLAALGVHRDVHVWLPHPSPDLWSALESTLASVAGQVPRDEDSSADQVGHPLLAALGRDGRELQALLGDTGAEVADALPAPSRPATLLGWLQADIAANRLPTRAELERRRPSPDDRSVQVHACHGPSRQVEVLREVLVGLLDDDPTLEPRDMVVMCPDVETFAPLISAAFGLADVVGDEGHPAHRLRVRLADRALPSVNPLLALGVRLVELSGSRVTATELLDLLGSTPVRARFRLTDDDLTRVTRWVSSAGIRWGLDAEQRSSYAMHGFAHNTWRAGLDRILLGVAMSEEDHRHIGTALPLDDLASGDIDLAGRLAEFADRLGECLASLRDAHGVEEWMSALHLGVRRLGDVPDAWQVAQFERELSRIQHSAGTGSASLGIADVRALFDARLGGRPTRANFRTGTLTVCTMVPMRSVPHRVVCLVGLDDGVVPRAGFVDGDDVLARRPLTGERDVRSEDRQLLLDAIMAATETLVVTYTGANEHTGLSVPPAVPLGEILDSLDTVTAEPVRDRVLVRHPLQAYDARNVTPGALGVPGPFSFDRAALAAAGAARGERRPPPPFLEGSLEPRTPVDVNLDDLKTFLLNPVRTFLRARLDVSAPLDAEELSDAIPIDLDGLERWGIGDRILRDLLAGQDAEATCTAELLRGTVPPGNLGYAALRSIVEEAGSLYAATADVRSGTERNVDVDVDLGGGRRLTGTVTGVWEQRVVSLGYSRLGPKQRLSTWVDLLALSATYPDQHWTGHAIGRSKAGPSRALQGPVDHRAVEWLRDLVALRDLGLTLPMPAPVKTACAWAEAHARELRGDDLSPERAAAKEWVTDPDNRWGITGEDDEAAHRQVYGDRAPLQRLVDGGLGSAAWRIWEPVLQHEKVGPL
jgi:exodeoxyribonuclease V gamma subunit